MSGSRKMPAIAVTGVGALFPGVPGPNGFWKTIISGRDCMTDVPRHYWCVDDYYDADPAARGKTYARRGAFLSSVAFDPIEHGIPPNMLPATDTAQLLSLIVAKDVLESSGALARLPKERISVILGVASSTELVSTMSGSLQRPVIEKALKESGIANSQIAEISNRIASSYADWTESTFPGLLGNVVAGRIANRFDLAGTNCVVDAACASSLAAIKMAVDELWTGAADMVISGGVDAINDIFMFMCFSKTLAMSKSGDCRPFSDEADGTMLGEGIGMFALRRLEDAERDGDQIFAVLRGIGSSSDGRAKSIYAPRPEGQAKALRRAYDAAGYGPGTVGLMEAHGTGTVAGDAAEVAALKEIFQESRPSDRSWCALGSVKSQIGHTKAAAGAASFYKAVMALHHKVLPPTIKVRKLNPALALSQSPFYLNDESRPWIGSADHPRRASVSSFGFGGSNFHLTLEEYCGPAAKPQRIRALETELVLFSGETPGELKKRTADAIVDANRNFVSTARRSQKAFDARATCRLAIVASDADDLKLKIERAFAAIDNNDVSLWNPAGIAYGTGKRDDGKIAFVFPGQGSQYVGMGAGLAVAFDECRRPWDSAEDIARVVFPPTVVTDDERKSQAARLADTRVAQPAIGILNNIYLGLLESLKIEPQLCAGHSFGEISALGCAGILSADAAVQVARERGARMADAAATQAGSMLAVAASEEIIRPLLPSLGTNIVIANVNSPKQVVLAGPVDQIASAASILGGRGMVARTLPVSTAFHSPIVEPALVPFARFLETIEFGSPRIPVFSNSAAAPYPAESSEARSLLAAQLAKPVRFADEIEAMYEAGARIFIEVGPGSVLTDLIGECLKGKNHVALPVDSKGKNAGTGLWNSLARLAAAGVSFDTECVWKGFAIGEETATSKSAAVVALSGTNYGKKYPGDVANCEMPGQERAKEIFANATIAAPPPPREDDKLATIRLIQERMAEAHSTAQRLLAESHLAYLKATELALTSFGSDASSVPVDHPIVRPAPSPVIQAVPVSALPPPPEKIAAPSPASLAALVIAVIAEHTGYPVDILTAEMDLEADLGIDSIKRVQILAAIAEKQPDLPPIEASATAGIRTIGAIITKLENTFPVSPPAPVLSAAAPFVAAAPVVATAPAGLASLVIAVIAEHTGYPVDILTPEMDLEADLGIDSIKRVQILASIAEKQPDLPPIEASATAGIRTIGAIIAKIENPSQASQPQITIERIGLEQVDAPQSISSELMFARAAKLAVVGCTDGIGRALVRQFQEKGIDAVLAADIPRDATDAIHLDFAETGRADVLQHAQRIFSSAKQFAESRGSEGGNFVIAHDGGSAWFGGISGIARTLGLEHPTCSVRSIELAKGERAPHEIADAIWNVISGEMPADEVTVDTTGRRTIVREVERPISNVDSSLLADRPVIIASGGARGVTAACLIALAKTVPLRVALLGRTSITEEPDGLSGIQTAAELKAALSQRARAKGETLTPKQLDAKANHIIATREIGQTLETLKRLGSEATYRAVDIRDGEATEQVVSETRRFWGRIDILIHGAGVIADKRIVDKSSEQFLQVFGTKVLGLRSLLDATRNDKLRFICLFSSVAGRYGNPGQADYAMANATMNRIAKEEAACRGPECAIRSLNWGPWDGGMVTPELRKHFAARGMPVIPLDEGAAAFVRELQHRSADPADVDVVLVARQTSSASR